MPIVTFKDLVIDAVDAASLARFWADRLGLTPDFDRGGGDAVLRGSDSGQTIWINTVPEPKVVKNRVHLDVVDANTEDRYEGLPVLSAPGEFSWQVFTDSDGQEFCLFVSEGASPALKDIVIDADDHVGLSRWWADVLGGELTHSEHGYSHLDAVPRFPGESFDFVPVPEAKTVKNRVHWDVCLLPGASVSDLLDRDARLLRAPDGEIAWTVMADPEGNEFCVFEER